MNRAVAFCRLCGRPRPGHADGWCSDRCAELAAAGYAAPALPPAALEPPVGGLEARVVVAADAALGDEVADLGLVSTDRTKRLVRVRSDSTARLAAVLEGFGSGDGAAPEVITLQRFAPRAGGAEGGRAAFHDGSGMGTGS